MKLCMCMNNSQTIHRNVLMSSKSVSVKGNLEQTIKL